MDSGSPADRLPHDIPDDETSELKALCDKRNNARITEYFKSKDDSTALKPYAADLFHFAVLQLTCNIDPDSLEEVLDFGQRQTPKLEVQWKEVEDVLSTDDPCLSRNPIMIASQQVPFQYTNTEVKLKYLFRAFPIALRFFTSMATGSPKFGSQLHKQKEEKRGRIQQTKNSSWLRTKSLKERNLERRSIIAREC